MLAGPKQGVCKHLGPEFIHKKIVFGGLLRSRIF